MKEVNNPHRQFASFNLQQLLEACLEKFKRSEQYKEITLHLIDDLVSPLCVISDQKKVEQVFMQLLVNAVENAGASKIIVSLKQLLKTEKDILLEFIVEDNGLDGYEIDINYQQQIQNIQLLIEKVGGKAEMSSVEGIGNTIKFIIKFLWDACPSGEIPESFSNKLKGKRILLAEDNEINQKIIAHLLRKEKIIVDIANDGREALELFENNNYDLVLLDLQMPFLDGFETANYIRKKLKSTIPIVAMTASAFSNEQTRCFEVGINQYLSKPFAAEDLFQRLRYFLLNEHQLNYQRPSQNSARDLYSLHLLKQANDEEQLIEILEMFIDYTPALLAEIQNELAEQKLAFVIKKTAKLKGSLGSLQMQSMMRIVDEIEMFIRLEDYNKIPMAVDRLYKEYELVGPLLEKELEELKTRVSVK